MRCSIAGRQRPAEGATARAVQIRLAVSAMTVMTVLPVPSTAAAATAAGRANTAAAAYTMVLLPVTASTVRFFRLWPLRH